MSTTIRGRAGLMARTDDDYFYVNMAIACLAVAFLGFAPTYWMPVAAGTFKANPIVHVHGLVFSAWTIFFVYQAWLAASGRLVRHRAVGLIGVSFATAMTILGVLVAINQMKTAVALGLGDAGREFSFVPLSSMVFFAVVVACALAKVRDRDWHKRLMLVATISILNAAVARWFLVFLAPPGPPGPPPVAVDVAPSLVACILLIICIVHDWRRRGRPHPAYLWGTFALVALKALEVPLSATATWRAVAGGVLALAG